MLIPYETCIQIFGKTFSNVVHIGAHYGEEVDAYQRSGVQSIYWFEANKNIMKHLFDATKQYSIKQEYFCEVLSDSDDQEIEFKITNNGQSSSILNLGTHQKHYPNITVIETKKLKTKRFDTVAKKENINLHAVDFINLDVQGAELKVLKGFGNIFEVHSNIKAVYSEVNFEEVYVGAPMVEEIDEYLGKYGFARIQTAVTPYKWGDALYIRK